jgi:tripartite-type tricarboxylate transporter receptor subunit TctC
MIRIYFPVSIAASSHAALRVMRSIIADETGRMLRLMRRFQILSCALALVALVSGASAQTWPSKPVRMIVLVPAGNAPDITARTVGDKLSQSWGQRVVIDNKPGAGGIVGMSALKQAGDGHTLALVQASVLLTTPYMYKDPQFNVDTDIDLIAMVGYSPMMVVANKNLPVSSLRELVDLAARTPGKITLATTGGAVSVPNLAGEMLNRAAGGNFLVVPFTSNAAASTAIMGEDAQLMVDGIPSLEPLIQSGSVRALATLSKARLPHRPDLPAAGETFAGFNATGWFVLVAPRGLPAPVIDRIRADTDAVMRLPDVTSRLSDLGIYAESMSADDLQRFVTAERKSWLEVIRAVGVTPQ